MDLVRHIRNVLLAAACTPAPATTLAADELRDRWVSSPRSAIKIVIGSDGGRISGPEWEYRFDARLTNLDFEIAPGRRFVLSRTGDQWMGQYFHPPIGPGDHVREPHSMLFVPESAGSR